MTRPDVPVELAFVAHEMPLGDDWEPSIKPGPLDVARVVANTFACTCGFSNPKGYPAVTRMHKRHHDLIREAEAAITSARTPAADAPRLAELRAAVAVEFRAMRRRLIDAGLPTDETAAAIDSAWDSISGLLSDDAALMDTAPSERADD